VRSDFTMKPLRQKQSPVRATGADCKESLPERQPPARMASNSLRRAYSRVEHHHHPKTQRAVAVPGVRRARAGQRHAAEGPRTILRGEAADLAEHVEPDQVVKASRRQAGAADRSALHEAGGMARSRARCCRAVGSREGVSRPGASSLAQYERRWTQGAEGSIAGSLAASVEQHVAGMRGRWIPARIQRLVRLR
jgi:hypothetical protein